MISVSTLQCGHVPPGEPIAALGKDGDVLVWPYGIGTGPLITFSRADWASVADAVAKVLRSADVGAGYTATEGCLG